MVYGIRIQNDNMVYTNQKDSDIRIVSVYGIWYKDSEGFSIWYNSIRIQKDSVYGIWYMDSEGFLPYTVYGIGISILIQYGIRIQKDSVYGMISGFKMFQYKDSEGFSIW